MKYRERVLKNSLKKMVWKNNKVKNVGLYVYFEDLNNKVVNMYCIIYRGKSLFGIMLEYFLGVIISYFSKRWNRKIVIKEVLFFFY